MKPGARVLGIDDSPFTKEDERVLVVGVVWREGAVEGVLSTHVARDGLDSTEKLERMVGSSKFLPQIRLIVMHGVTLAGFNIVNIRDLSEKLSVPVIGVTRKRPCTAAVGKALRNFPDCGERLELIRSAGPVVRIGTIHAQLAGIGADEARKFLSSFEGIPEPVRLAHIIGSGVVRGESHGKV